MSHFAESENPDSTLTKLQIRNCKDALTLLKSAKITLQWIHVANSGGILNAKKLNLGSMSNMARAGLDLYGIDPRPTENDKNLKPVLKLTTRIVQIKELKKGDKVGYNGTFTAKKDMAIAILPIGYYDGVDRRLSNKGMMLIDGISCLIIGRVSMNITAVDISKVKNPRVGQQVIVFSNNLTDMNSIATSASICETIPYDLLVHLATSTRRDIV
jgi:alanine racemase